MTPLHLDPEKISKNADVQRGYEMGWNAAMDRRKVYVDFATEKEMPVEWAEYTNQEEREVIASIVQDPLYQEFFKRNLMYQAMLKWRQARMAKSSEATQLLFQVGNFLMELIEFYEHAKDNPVQKMEETDGFSSFPEPE